MFERFTEPGIKVVVTAQEEARKIGNNFVGTEQILLGLLAETSGIGGRMLRKFGVTLRLAREEIKRLVGRGSGFVAVEIPFTPRARRVLENAIEESKSLGFPYVGPEHILLGILMEDSGIAITALRKILRDVNPEATFEMIRKRTLREMGEEFAVEFNFSQKDNSSTETEDLQNLNPETTAMINPNGLKDFSPADLHPYFDPQAPLLLSPVLNEFTTNITQMAFAGDIDPVIGRDSEVERVLQILSRRRKNNPILLGEPGVGKTAVAEGLALQIIAGNVPLVLQGKNIITLDLGLIIAGSRYRGDFEKRLKRVISDVQLTQCYILVIDEVHTLVGAGAAEGSLDAANILKPALARGEFQCIGATTVSEYRKYIEPDAALARRFQSVVVNEPSVDDTINILVGIRDKYESHHGVQITQNALEEAAVLSSRYINDRYLPDKAIDIIDEACSRVRLGYELIPNICNEFEDQLAAICREKEATYSDKDWLTALGILREEIKFVQQFLTFLYELIGKLKEEKKIWIIRGLQQRYQFILKGIGPLLKEWDIVLAIYDNERLIYKLKLEESKTNRRSKKKTKKLPKPKNSEELEKQLIDYRAQNLQQTGQNFINNPPLDKTGKPVEYDSDISSKATSELDEMNPFAEQEIRNIETEISNMQDLDEVNKMRQKFDEQETILPDSREQLTEMSELASETIFLDDELSDPTNTQDLIFEQMEEVFQQQLTKKGKTKSKVNENITEAVKKWNSKQNYTKPKKNAFNIDDWERAELDLANGNEETIALLKNLNSSASAIEFREKLSNFKIPFDEQNIPKKIVDALSKKVFFTLLFTPFGKNSKVKHKYNYEIFAAEEKKLNFMLDCSHKNLNKAIQYYEVLDGTDVMERKFSLHHRKWILLSFIIWNRALLEQNFEKK